MNTTRYIDINKQLL